MTAEEVLAKAATIVEQGWLQNHYYNHQGTEYCIVGALRMAIEGVVTPLSLWNEPVYHEVVDALYNETGYSALPAYNDAPGRTATEVATTLRNAKRWL